MKAIINYK